MNTKKKTSLKKKMIFFFLLIAIANIFVAGEFVFEIKSDTYRNKVVKEIALIVQGEKPIGHINVFLDNLADKFWIMTFVLIIVSAVILYLFVKQVASPIQYMINQAEKMSDGDLSIRIDIKSNDELAVLGKLINSLSVNNQEILAQLERLVAQMEEIFESHKKNISMLPGGGRNFDGELIKLQEIIDNFVLMRNTFILYTIESMKENARKDI